MKIVLNSVDDVPAVAETMVGILSAGGTCTVDLTDARVIVRPAPAKKSMKVRKSTGKGVRHWSEEDDRIATGSDSIEEKAKTLGRTVGAVRQRINVLQHKG